MRYHVTMLVLWARIVKNKKANKFVSLPRFHQALVRQCWMFGRPWLGVKGLTQIALPPVRRKQVVKLLRPTRLMGFKIIHMPIMPGFETR